MVLACLLMSLEETSEHARLKQWMIMMLCCIQLPAQSINYQWPPSCPIGKKEKKSFDCRRSGSYPIWGLSSMVDRVCFGRAEKSCRGNLSSQ